MLVRLFDRGTGAGRGPVDYCIAHVVPRIDYDTGRRVRGAWIRRVPPPVVLSGDPERTRRLIDSISNKWKYTSGVIAFERDDSPSDADIRAVIDDFERMAFAGLERDQYEILWVKHTHEGNTELHFVVPRIELRTGKALNIAPPGHEDLFNAWRDSWNWSKGWARPDDPARARVVRRDDHVIKTDAARIRDGLAATKDPKSAITEWLTDRIKAGLVKNRADIVASLSEIGEITRQGEDYVSVKPAGFTKAVRLKGVIYERSFDSARFIRDFAEQAAARPAADRAVDETRARKARDKLEKLAAARAKYHSERYRVRSSEAARDAEREHAPEHTAAVVESSADQERSAAVASVDRESVAQAAANERSDLAECIRRELGADAVAFEQHRAAATDTSAATAADSAAAADASAATAADVRYRTDERQQRQIHRFAASDSIREWIQSWQSRCLQAIEKVRGFYDRAGEIFERRFSSIVSAIRVGHESAVAAERELVTASASVIAASRETVAASAAVNTSITRDCRKLKMRNDDELTRFKTEINLVEYAESCGYEIDRRESSRASTVMRRSDDKIIVATDADGHGIYFSVRDDRDNGTIIDFVQRRRGLNLGQLRKELRPWLSGAAAPVRRPAQQRPARPERSSVDRQRVLAVWMRMQPQPRNGHAYLRDERMLDESVLTDVRFASMIRVDSRGNAVFPHYDEAGLCGYELKNRGFTGFSKGGQKALWHTTNIEQAQRIVIVESAIDAMSHAQITQDGGAAYVSTGGALSDRQRELLRRVMHDAAARGAEIVIATDSDEAGHKFAREIAALAPAQVRLSRQVPQEKDWNDVVLAQREREMRAQRERGYGMSM